MYTSRFLRLAFVPLILLAFLAPTVRSVIGVQEPVLSVPGDIIAHSGDVVQVPVRFTGGGHAIAGVAFSLDFEESCLAFNPIDNDGNGLPDGVHLLIPGGFRPSVSFDATDSDGELDVIIYANSYPSATLPDQTLLTIDFTVICTPAPTTTHQAPVVFALLPRPSFSNPNGRNVAGSSQGGAVTVLGAQVDTPTPATTPTPTATSTSTATSTATAAPASTATSTATVAPASTATATMETPAATATPTVTPTPTLIETVAPTTKPATPTPTLIATGTVPPPGRLFWLYMPLVVR